MSLSKTKRSQQVEATRKKLKEMLSDNVINLRRFMRGIGATGAKVQEKGKLVHQAEPIQQVGEGLTRAVLTRTNNPQQVTRGRRPEQ